MLIELAKMSKAEREGHEWFELYLDVRKYGWKGVFKIQDEKWKAILRQGEKEKKLVSRHRLASGDNRKQLGLWREK